MLGILPALDADYAPVTAAINASCIALRRTVEQYGPLVPEWCPRMWRGDGVRRTLQRCTQEGARILYPAPTEEMTLRTFWAMASAVPPECRNFDTIRLSISDDDSGASPVAVRAKSVEAVFRDMDVFVASAPYITCDVLTLEIWGVTPEAFLGMPALSSLTSLTLTWCGVDSSVLGHLTALTSLTSLTVVDVDGPTSAECDAFCGRLSSMHRIKELTLRGPGIAYDGVRHLGRMRGLTDLTIGGSNVTDEGVRGVLVNPGLRSLNLEESDGVTDESLSAIASRGKSITSLTLIGLSNVRDEGLRCVCAHEGITSLSLVNLKQVTDEGLRSVCAMKALTSLTLYSLKGVTDEGLRCVYANEGVVSLTLRELPGVTDDGLRWVGRQSKLTSLTLDSLQITTGLQHLVSLHRLRALRLCFIEIGDDDFKVVGTLSSLTSLRIENLWKLTADGVRALLALPRLRTLHIIGMPDVRDAVPVRLRVKRFGDE